MTDEQKAAAEFYAKATPKEARKRALRKYKMPFAEIFGTDGRVHYRRPLGDPLIAEAEQTPGYSVRVVTKETKSRRTRP
jgi:hypothetical protein